MKFLTTASDPGGVTRAWGKSDTPEASEAEARRQLALYLADAISQPYKDPGDYVFETSGVDEDPPAGESEDSTTIEPRS